MKRPLLVSIFCSVGFLGSILTPFILLSGTSPVSISPQSVELPTWYLVFSLIVAVMYVFSLVEIWKIKKRGIEI
ncbi:hypothetical protein KC573_03815, partial [candidate division WWE3 bacterium]|nr:hypothetical protein [candidate division WWE3 bacterium]